MDIKDKVVIVTGASSGIGAALAKQLSSQGARVVLAARSKTKLEQLSRDLPGSLVVPADMTKLSDIKKLVRVTLKKYGRIDILINNAGQGYFSPVESINPGTFRGLIELNVIGPLVAMQQVIPVMKSQGGGYIVNISSGTALMYLPNLAAYSSTKRALGGISLTARQELAADHIGVSVVYPYITDTDFYKNTISETRISWDSRGAVQPADSAEYVAEITIKGLISVTPEIYAHDWMFRPSKS